MIHPFSVSTEVLSQSLLLPLLSTIPAAVIFSFRLTSFLNWIIVTAFLFLDLSSTLPSNCKTITISNQSDLLNHCSNNTYVISLLKILPRFCDSCSKGYRLKCLSGAKSNIKERNRRVCVCVCVSIMPPRAVSFPH